LKDLLFKDHPARLPRELLFRLREPNAVFPEIVDGVILSQKGVADDPDGAEGGRNVDALEGRDTCSLGVQDVVCGGETEVVAREGECDIGEGGDFVAVYGVGSVPGLFGADFFV